MKKPIPLLHTRIVPAGRSGIQISVTPRQAGWEYVGFSVRQIGRGEKWSGRTGRHEACLVLLSGLASVSWSPDSARPVQLGPRRDVFSDYPMPSTCRRARRSRCTLQSGRSWPSADRLAADAFLRG
jgi:5-deoxy-D-glucuronate isomerase